MTPHYLAVTYSLLKRFWTYPILQAWSPARQDIGGAVMTHELPMFRAKVSARIVEGATPRI